MKCRPQNGAHRADGDFAADENSAGYERRPDHHVIRDTAATDA